VPHEHAPSSEIAGVRTVTAIFSQREGVD
jgi:hypothetical protein